MSTNDAVKKIEALKKSLMFDVEFKKQMERTKPEGGPPDYIKKNLPKGATAFCTAESWDNRDKNDN